MLFTLEILLLSLLMICGLCAYGLALPFFLEKIKINWQSSFLQFIQHLMLILTYGYV